MNLKMPAELVEQLREEAREQGVTLTALVEKKLRGEPAAATPASSGLSDRLAAIEDRLAVLESRGARPPGVRSAKEKELLVPMDAAAGAERLGSAELAVLLGLGRSALNNWAAKNQPGAVRDGWRLLGRVPSSRGGPPRLLWERCAETQDLRRNSM
jgi:hypothetical protein